MSDIASLEGINEFPFITVNSGVIIELSESFAAMTEFQAEDFINKTILDVFKILRVGPDINCEDIDDTHDYFLFTKSFEVKFINIKIIRDEERDVYIFRENLNLRLEAKFPLISTLCSDNYYGMGVYSMPDMTLLKASDKYISFFDEPFNKKENCIGKRISEFAKSINGSKYEDIWNIIVKTRKTYNIDEYKYESLCKGRTTYWKLSIVPICEDDKVKYCIVMAMEITEQILHRKKIKHQEKIIKQQNKHLVWQAGLLDHSREAIFAWELDGGIVYWNKGAERMYGYSSKEALGCVSQELLKTIYPEHLENIKLEMLGDELWNGEIEHTRKDGTKLIVETYHQIITDENGYKIVLETNRDITERKKMEKELKHHNEQLQAIIDNISEELYIVDKEMNFLKVNKAVREKYPSFQISNSDKYIKGNKIYDLLGNEMSFEKSPAARLARGEYIKDETIVINVPYKRYLSINAKPIFDSRGDFYIGVILLQDITTRILQEQRIKHQNEQLNAIINSMSDGLELVDNKMKITFLNQSAKDFFYNADAKINAGDSLKYNKYYYGIDGDEIPSRDLPAFRVLEKGSFENYIVTIERPDKKIYASINGSIIKTDNDTETEAILAIRDITEQIMRDKVIEYHQKAALQAEREKNEALEKAMEMKDEFLSLISHEFRTPLNVINTAIQALNYLCGSELSDKSKKYINTIRQNTFRQLRLVNNLLDITRADAGRIKIYKKNIDLVFLTNSIVESVCTYASQKGVKLTFVCSIEKKVIGMDDEKYERILLNLLSNAIKFTPKGKSIVVKLRAFKNNIRLQVQDDGIGIPEEKVDVIFERFGQVDSSLSRQAEGAGIGLSLVKKLVDALGGSISVKSKEGKGSTFTILFPNEKIVEQADINPVADLLDNRLVQVTTVEFSDIYL